MSEAAPAAAPAAPSDPLAGSPADASGRPGAVPAAAPDPYSARYASLAGKSVFVTGGSTGIGAELVRAFAAQGARVAFNGRNVEAATRLCDEIERAGHPRPLFRRTDVTDVEALRADIAAAADAFGDVEVLVNNVANDERHDFERVDAAYFDWMVAINLRPAFFAIQAALPGMRRRGGGSVINVGSISWRLKNPGYAAYATLKSASLGLTRSLARELGAHRIRINHVALGWVMTDKQVRLWLDEAGERSIRENQCLPDKLMPQDAAAMVLFLAADDSRMITAGDFTVDAGWT